MRLNWETGYYFDAGKRFGNLWKSLIGEPQWIDDFELNYGDESVNQEQNSGERYPLADFYAAQIYEIW